MARPCAKNGSVFPLIVLVAVLGLALGNAAYAQTPTTTTLTADVASPSRLGQAVTFTATVTGAGATGQVDFVDGATVIGSVTLDSLTGQAQFVTALLAVGAHSITAQYSGDALFLASTSSALSYTTDPRPANVTITLGTNPVGVAANSTATVNVTDASLLGPPGTPGAFAASAAALGTRRLGHAAAKLRDGRVLVAGGQNELGAILSSAEYFDPTLAVSTPLGTGLNTARYGATATLLQDGTVLFVGGSTTGLAAGAVASAETFDPATGVFTTLGVSLNTPRFGHTATLLSNGMVLIAGGQDSTGAPLNTIEVFDPAGPSFTAVTGTLAATRFGHSATLLADDSTILVAGGDLTGTAELLTYNSGTNVASTSGNVTWATSRVGHSATLLPHGDVLIAGGTIGGVPANSAEIYHAPAPSTLLASNFVSVAGALNTVRAGQTATLLNSALVLVAGGTDLVAAVSSMEVYTPSFDPSGTVTVTSGDGGTSDTIGSSPCTLAVGGAGVSSCQVTVTPVAVSTGTHAVDASYSGETNHSANTGTANLTVEKGTPVITWANPADLTYGAALSAAELNATADVAGTFVYTPALGTVLHAGNAQTLHVDFTPTDTTNYNTAAQNASINVLARALNVTATATNRVYDGTTDATSLVTLADDRLPGDVLTLSFTASFANKNVGTGKTVTVSSIAITGGANQADYALANTTTTSSANITARPLTVTASGTSKVYDGTASANTAVTLSDDRAAGDLLTFAFTATFADKNAGTGKAVSVTGISINGGADQANYSLVNTTASTVAAITLRPLNVTATAANKVYDSTVTATATLADDRLAGDALTLGSTASFVNKNVGVGKTVNVTGIVITGGLDQGNYSLANTTTATTADITAKPLNVTAAGVNKVYDATTAATVTLSDDRVAGDVLTFSSTANFADKNVAATKPVSVTGIGISGGADQGNYSLANTTAATTADITVRSLHLTATATSKVYDGTAAAKPLITLSDDRVFGDVLTLDFSASFADKNAGVGKTISVTGITITGGTDQTNYTLASTTTSTTADITKRPLNATATGGTKVYDGNTTAPVTLSDDRIAGDLLTVAFTCTFADKNVGAPKPVSCSGGTITAGADQGNYTVNATTSTTASITVRPLNVTATTVNKVYDGNANATSQTTLHDDRVAGDTLTFAFAAAFNDKDVGVGKTVNVTAIAINGGADQLNYNLVNNTTSSTANITGRPLTVTATTTDKVYDGLTEAKPITTLHDDRVAGDVLTIVFATANFDSKHTGAGKTVSVTGIAISPGGDQANYALVSPTTSTTAAITPRNLAVTATAVNKQYDGTAEAKPQTTLHDDRVAGDDLTFNFSASFNNKSVGVAKPVGVTGITVTGGVDQLNYNAPNAATSASADITVRQLHITHMNGVNKTYDGNNLASALFDTDDRVSGDALTLAFAAATFPDKNVGTGRIVTVSGITITGGVDQGNYVIGTPTVTTVANITVRDLHVTAMTGTNKVYDGTIAAAATFNTDDRVAGDSLTLGYAAATFPDKNVGTGRNVHVTGISITGGADAGNYTVPVTTFDATADITRRPLVVTATAADRVYDGTVNANPQTTLQDNRVLADNLTVVFTTATFDNKNVAASKLVSVSGIAVTGGTDQGNYSLVNTTTTATASITARALTVAASAGNKFYDGSVAAAVTGITDNRVAGDVLTFASSGLFADAEHGTKPVTVSIAISGGADANNYFVQNPTVTATATINANPTTSRVVFTAVAVAGNGEQTFTLRAAVTPTSPLVPGTPVTGTVRFRDGAVDLCEAGNPAVCSKAVDAAGVALLNVKFSGAAAHNITLTYSDDVRQNFVTTSSLTSLTIAAAVTTSAGQPINPVTVNVRNQTTSPIALTSLLCSVQSASGTVANTRCEATANPTTIAAGGTSDLTVKITTNATTSAALNPQLPFGGAWFGTMALAFLGLTLPAGAVPTRRRKLLALVGLALIALVLVLGLVGCGGNGFTNASGLVPSGVTGATPPGNYAAVVTYTDAQSNSVPLATVPVNVSF